MSYILYVFPAWGGFLTADLMAKIDAFLRRAAGCGFKCLSDVLYDADRKLYRRMAAASSHCIHQLLPSPKVLPMKLHFSQCASSGSLSLYIGILLCCVICLMRHTNLSGICVNVVWIFTVCYLWQCLSVINKRVTYLLTYLLTYLPCVLTW